MSAAEDLLDRLLEREARENELGNFPCARLLAEAALALESLMEADGDRRDAEKRASDEANERLRYQDAYERVRRERSRARADGLREAATIVRSYSLFDLPETMAEELEDRAGDYAVL